MASDYWGVTFGGVAVRRTENAYLIKGENMHENNERIFNEYLIAVMTSGLPHKGASYKLPESLALEYGRLCYNQAIKDMMAIFKMSDFGQVGLEICDRMQDLHVKGKR